MKKIDGCKNPNYRVEALDQVIIDEIKKLKLAPGYLDKLIAAKKEEPKQNEEIRIRKKRLQEIENKINKLMDLYTLGTIPLAEIGDRVKPLSDEKTQLETEIENYESEKKKAPEVLSKADTQEILDRYITGIDKADLATKRNLVQALIKRIEIGTEPDSLKIFWKFV